MLACLALAATGCERLLGLGEVRDLLQSPRALVFDNSYSATDLVNFPVLVALDAGKLAYADVSDPTRDLRFADDHGDLPFEVERWDPQGESIVWVLAPLITGGSQTDRILMYYGPDAHGSAMPAGVWADYAFVYHGSGSDVVNANDVAMAYPDDSGVMPTTELGILGDATRFDGHSRQRIEFTGSAPLFDGWKTFSVEEWVRPVYSDQPALNPDEPRIMGKIGGPVESSRVRNSGNVSGAPLDLETDFSFASQTQYPYYHVASGIWSYASYSYDGQLLWSYHDGIADDAAANPMPMALESGTSLFVLGSDGGLLSINGDVDEIRVSRTYHNDDWFHAQYLSMTRHFVTFTDP